MSLLDHPGAGREVLEANVHVLDLLEGWQARSGLRARGWLAALGEAEALAALARLQPDNPTRPCPSLTPPRP